MLHIAFNKKQTVILVALLAALLAATVFLVLAVSCTRCRAAEPAWTDDPPEEALSQNEWVVPNRSAAATEAPEPDAIFVSDAQHPMPQDGAVLNEGEAYTIGGTVYCNYPLASVTVNVTCAHNNGNLYP